MSKFFPQGTSRTLFIRARRNLAVLGVWPIDTYSSNLVNVGILLLYLLFYCTHVRMSYVSNSYLLTYLFFLGRGKIFESGYLAHYLSEHEKIWQRWVWQIDTYSPHLVNFGLFLGVINL